MTRVLLTLACAAALGAMLLPGARSARRDGAVGPDTTVVSRSIAFFESKLAADPGSAPVAVRLADRYVLRFQQTARLEDVARAEELARRVIPLDHDPATDRARLSAVLLMQHEFSEAYEAARAAVMADSTNQAALGAWFDAALAAGRYTELGSALARIDRKSIGWRLRNAQLLDAAGKAELAFHSMRRVCERFDRAAARPIVRAWCLTELARIEQTRAGAAASERMLVHALRVQPGYRGALEGLADLAHARGDWRKAIRLYERIVADAHPDLHLRLAEARRALHDETRARFHETEFVRLAAAPGAEQLHAVPLALHFARQHATRDEALAVILRDLERRQSVESWDALSWVRFQRGEFEDALAASDRARAWGAPSPTMDLHRARILEALGRAAEASELFRSAIADPTLLDPNARNIAPPPWR